MRVCMALSIVLLAGCSGASMAGDERPGGDAGGFDDDGDGGDEPGGDAGPVTALEMRYTEHLGQLTGTTLNPVLPLGFSGTDLGVAFSRDDKVAFLFGDAWLDDRDQMATAPLALPEDGMPELSFATTAGGQFQPLAVPGVDLDGFDVPVEAVPVGDTTYYFFTSGYDFDSGRHSRSVLAHGQGLDISSLVLDHSVPSDKFFNVQVVVEAGEAWIFSSGPYRKSPVYLARVELSRLAERDAWRYWPDFSEGAGEAAAEPLVDVSCVGELSVRRHPATGLWLMAYNCDQPRGIHLRTATSPTGPWSEPQLIYTPEMGYEHFIHASESAVGHDDGLSWPGREDEWGGEYGPYLVPEWFSSPEPGVHEIVYTLSSWNPYQVHLMRTVLAEPGVAAEAPVRGKNLPEAVIENGDFAGGSTAGWTQTGGPFGTFQRPDGSWRLTTFVGDPGHAATGTLWQEFGVDATTSELRFLLHGGDGRVELWVGDEVVRQSRARRENENELEVRWNLEQLRGEKVRVVIVDDLSGDWGFVGAGGFELR